VASAPNGHALRRAQTLEEASNLRRRLAAGSIPSPHATLDAHRRRSSTFSENSFASVRDALNPNGRTEASSSSSSSEYSHLAYFALAFALLPAMAGSLFKDGSAIVTDIMLLGLAGIFLYWSVTQPWSWYHAAQEIRIIGEEADEDALEEDDDSESLSHTHTPGSPSSTIEDAAAQRDQDDDSKEDGAADQASPSHPPLTKRQQAAVGELYIHEVAALLSCAALPILSACLLHAIRVQLSRPSEGLVSNYNLTIFLLVAEFRVVSHVTKLVQSRTLYLQNVVRTYPFAVPSDNTSQLEQMFQRLDRLEARSAAEEALVRESLNADTGKAKQDATTIREVRNAIQPELDALNRAVRRYEKKATVLQTQTEARFNVLSKQVGDAITLAAAATKISSQRKGFLTRVMEGLAFVVLFPLQLIIRLILFPSRLLLPLFSRKKRDPNPQRTSRSSRQVKGAPQSQVRYSGDRVPSRVSRR
jgi:hypothetical protein